MTHPAGVIRDPQSLGPLPVQHFETNWDIGKQLVLYGIRVKKDVNESPARLEHDGEPSLVTGDLGRFLLWERQGAMRPCSHFGIQVNSVLTDAPHPIPPVQKCGKCKKKKKKLSKTRARGKAGGKVGSHKLQPLREAGTPDFRFQTKAPIWPQPWSSRYPKGWTGRLGRAMEEYEDSLIWSPDFLGVVCANQDGDPEFGTRFFDLDKTSGVDATRWRESQSLLSVLDLGDGYCKASGLALALQLGTPRLEPGRAGYMPIVDYENCRVGFANVNCDGPLVLEDGQHPCKHTAKRRLTKGGGILKGSRQQADADGTPFGPTHLAAEFCVLSGGHDGPMYFREESYDSNILPDLPLFPTQVYCRFREDTLHSIASGTYVGKWDWQVYIPFTVEKKPYPPPPPLKPYPPPKDPPPPGGKPPPPPPVPPPRLPPEKTKYRVSGGEFFPGDDAAEDEGAIGPFGRGLRLGPIIGGYASDAHAATTIGVLTPAIVGRAIATAAGSAAALKGARIPPEQWRAAPITGRMTAYGAGDGSWDGWLDRQDQYGQRFADGGWVLHPQDAEIQEILSGDFTQEGTNASVHFVVPGNLASIDFAHPSTTTSGLTTAGVRLEQTAAGLQMGVLDGDGEVVASPKFTFGEGGGIFTGGLSVTGKLTVGGLIDPMGYEFDKQASAPIGGSNYGTWVSDGTVSGTVDGGLYYDRAGTRVRVDVASASGGHSTLYSPGTRVFHDTTVLTTMHSYTVPGGTLGTNGDRLVLRGQIVLPWGGTGNCTVQVLFGGTVVINESLAPHGATNKNYNYEVVLPRANAAQVWNQSSFKGGLRATSDNVRAADGIHTETGDVGIGLTLANPLAAEVKLAVGTNGDLIASGHFSVDFLPA